MRLSVVVVALGTFPINPCPDLPKMLACKTITAGTRIMADPEMCFQEFILKFTDFIAG